MLIGIRHIVKSGRILHNNRRDKVLDIFLMDSLDKLSIQTVTVDNGLNIAKNHNNG